MKKIISLMLAALPLMLSSCATPPPPTVFRGTDSSALVIKSLDSKKCELLKPTASAPGANDLILSQVQALPQHQTAVVILENYTEASIGEQFRDRGTPLFVALRGLKYEHIIFLKGSNVSDPNGLITLAEYY